MAIVIVIIAFFISFFCWLTWDTYMKLLGKPIIEKKFVRFLFIHRGRYWLNELKINGTEVSLPSEKDIYSISRTVFYAQVISFIYVTIVILLDIIGIATVNNTLSAIAAILASFFTACAIVSLVISGHKLAVTERKTWNKKYIELIQDGMINDISCTDAEIFLQQGKKLKFKLYDFSFIVSSYNIKKWQLIDLIHNKIIITEEKFLQLLKNVEINNKMLYELWPYLKISIEEDF